MSTPQVDFYADFQGLAALRTSARAQDPAALKAAAQQFESLFTQMLLKNMREAGKSFGDPLFGSDQSDFYQSMFDEQIAMQLSQGKGLGLAEMLIRQLSTDGRSDRSADDLQGTQGGEPAATQGGITHTGAAQAGAGSRFNRSGAMHGAISGTAAVGTAGGAGGAGRHDDRVTLGTGKEDFIRSLWPHASRVAGELGIDPHALLAQAALETGWGRSVPCTADGSCSFNLFGIKAGGQWQGGSVNVPTLEYEGGVAVRKVERFRAYESPADSFRDYAQLIRHTPRYEDALNVGDDVAAFANALQRGGYATDPDYARKIVSVAADVRAVVGGLKPGRNEPISLYAGIRT